MLGIFEKRHFQSEEKLWVGAYRNLTNILHWHPECELIRIVKGDAQIKIGNSLLHATSGDCLFCGAEEPHYIIGTPDSIIEIMIFHKALLKRITPNYRPLSPLLSNPAEVKAGFEAVRRIIAQKPRFYQESLENCAAGILLSVFNQNDICPNQVINQEGKSLIDKINSESATVSFREMVRFSGYGASHFSKLFKRITGMTFSDYINYVKTEHAISLIQSDRKLTIANVCLQCGFSTIRNFNRVFKQITGFTPSTLPDDFVANREIRISRKEGNDPTSKTSILLYPKKEGDSSAR